MSEFNEPWRDVEGVVLSNEREKIIVDVGMYSKYRNRTIACVNALSGIANPSAVQDLIEHVEELLEWEIKDCVDPHIVDNIEQALAALKGDSDETANS
ncbi:MAG: hypothetical protein GY841_00675 [FCB group bacterium]|nr:hypothetical protein [FCB group bacterium]